MSMLSYFGIKNDDDDTTHSLVSPFLVNHKLQVSVQSQMVVQFRAQCLASGLMISGGFFKESWIELDVEVEQNKKEYRDED
jgi:hypothetical protein